MSDTTKELSELIQKIQPIETEAFPFEINEVDYWTCAYRFAGDPGGRWYGIGSLYETKEEALSAVLSFTGREQTMLIRVPLPAHEPPIDNSDENR